MKGSLKIAFENKSYDAILSNKKFTVNNEYYVETNPNTQSKERDIRHSEEVMQLMHHPLTKNINPKLVETVLNELTDFQEVDWEDVAGLNEVKNTIKEIVIWPLLRPHIFIWIRSPPKGILLFGPHSLNQYFLHKCFFAYFKMGWRGGDNGSSFSCGCKSKATLGYFY